MTQVGNERIEDRLNQLQTSLFSAGCAQAPMSAAECDAEQALWRNRCVLSKEIYCVRH